MASRSVKEELLLVVELLEAFSEFIAKIGSVEKRGLSLSKIRDLSYLSELGKKILSELNKDQFVAVMGLWYELGKSMATDVWSLSPDEKINFASKILEVTRQVKETLKR